MKDCKNCENGVKTHICNGSVCKNVFTCGLTGMKEYEITDCTSFKERKINK